VRFRIEIGETAQQRRDGDLGFEARQCGAEQKWAP